MLDGLVVTADALASSQVVSARLEGTREEPAAPGGSLPDPRKLGGLVLTRHLGESIMIGDAIEVQVVDLKAGTARLKVVAPRSVPVHRREIFENIRSGVPPRAGVGLATPKPGKASGGLVLARSVGQSIMIGEDVEVAVVEARPSVVKLKVSAPRSVAVHRREVFDRLVEQA